MKFFSRLVVKEVQNRQYDKEFIRKTEKKNTNKLKKNKCVYKKKKIKVFFFVKIVIYPNWVLVYYFNAQNK